MTDQPLKECPECKGELIKLLFPVGIVFKGSGFHVNDYPNAKSSTAGNGKRAEETTQSKSESDKTTAAASKD